MTEQTEKQTEKQTNIRTSFLRLLASLYPMIQEANWENKKEEKITFSISKETILNTIYALYFTSTGIKQKDGSVLERTREASYFLHRVDFEEFVLPIVEELEKGGCLYSLEPSQDYSEMEDLEASLLEYTKKIKDAKKEECDGIQQDFLTHLETRTAEGHCRYLIERFFPLYFDLTNPHFEEQKDFVDFLFWNDCYNNSKTTNKKIN